MGGRTLQWHWPMQMTKDSFPGPSALTALVAQGRSEIEACTRKLSQRGSWFPVGASKILARARSP